MTATVQPPPDACRVCSVSRKACDRRRELRGPCCDGCAHTDTEPAADLGATSEGW